MNLGEIKIENNKPFGIKTIITLRIEDNIWFFGGIIW
jgi:hypothetical protein